MQSALVLVGRFGAVHGVRGEIRVKSFTADPMAIAGYRGLTDSTGTRNFAFRKARYIKEDMLVAQISGIDDRDSAGTIVNVDIFVPRANLPPPDEDEFYFADLIGLPAILESGERFGTVRLVENFGAGDFLTVETPDGGTALLPFTKAVVPKVDIAGRSITVVPPVEVDGEPEGGA
jgi:16S rRNA processing protein RimM